MDDEEMHTTDYYDLRRIFNGTWWATVLAWLRDGPRRPRDLEAVVDGWRFYDRWRETSRGLTHPRVHEALTALTRLGLVDKQEDGTGFGHPVEYGLTEAGKAYLIEMDRQREWLQRYPFVLDQAVAFFHDSTTANERTSRAP